MVFAINAKPKRALNDEEFEIAGQGTGAGRPFGIRLRREIQPHAEWSIANKTWNWHEVPIVMI